MVALGFGGASRGLGGGEGGGRVVAGPGLTGGVEDGAEPEGDAAAVSGYLSFLHDDLTVEVGEPAPVAGHAPRPFGR